MAKIQRNNVIQITAITIQFQLNSIANNGIIIPMIKKYSFIIETLIQFVPILASISTIG